MYNPTLLGEIVSVAGSSILIELTKQVDSGLVVLQGRTYKVGQVGSFIRIPQGFNDLFGIISETSEHKISSVEDIQEEKRLIKVELVGESVNNAFERGIGQYPNINDEAHFVTETDLRKIYGEKSEGQIHIGSLSSSESIKVSLDLNLLVNRHSAVLGSTGSGKSTSVSSLLRSIAADEDDSIIRPSSRVILFDIHGEYSSALKDISIVFSINPVNDEFPLYIPYWCVNPEKLIEFLCGSNESLRNRFIDLLLEQKKAFVKKHMPNLAPEKITPHTPIPFYLNRIWYDLCHEDSVTWKEKEQINENYIDKGNMEDLIPPSFVPPCTKNDALSVKGGNNNWKRYLTQFRSRLIDSQYDFFLKPGDWSVDKDLNTNKDLDLLLSDWLSHNQPITILDLSGMPSARLDLLLGSALDILFEAAVWGRFQQSGMKEKPLLLVLEEAHRYLSNDSDGLAKDMIRRIAKEGRKFGVGSMLVSQRPSEIDETILSQCGTLIALRMTNSSDRSKVKSVMADSLTGIVDSLPILRTGEAVITGEAIKLPMRCKFRTPKEGRFPDSRDPDITSKWVKDFNQDNFSDLIHGWRNQSPVRPNKEDDHG
ncbi:MAG: ATP-binding protein [Colwellia sp.]